MVLLACLCLLVFVCLFVVAAWLGVVSSHVTCRRYTLIFVTHTYYYTIVIRCNVNGRNCNFEGDASFIFLHFICCFTTVINIRKCKLIVNVYYTCIKTWTCTTFINYISILICLCYISFQMSKKLIVFKIYSS